MLNNEKNSSRKINTVWKIMVYLKLLIVDDEGQKVISVRWIIKKEKNIYISQC